MWQKIRLKRQYTAALEQIDEHLAYWPKFLVHKNKQRLTKVTQYLIRMRKLAIKTRPKLITMPAQKEKLLKRKEAKAEVAAQLEKSIEKELLARLQSGTYGDIYNFPMKQYRKVLQSEAVLDEGAEIEKDEAAEEEEEEEEEEEYDEFIEGDEEDSEDEEEEIEWLNEDEVDLSDDDMEDYSDDSELDDDDDDGSSEEEGSDEEEEKKKEKGGKRSGGKAALPGKGKGRRGRMEIEYEEEREQVRH
jgi:protein MAK16